MSSMKISKRKKTYIKKCIYFKRQERQKYRKKIDKESSKERQSKGVRHKERKIQRQGLSDETDEAANE